MLTLVGCAVLVIAVAAVIADSRRSRCRDVHVVATTRAEPSAVLSWARASFAVALKRHGYDVIFADEARIVFERIWRPTMVWFLTVVLFPIGLIVFVLSRRRSVLALVVTARASDGSNLGISGEAPQATARTLDRLTQPP